MSTKRKIAQADMLFTPGKRRKTEEGVKSLSETLLELTNPKPLQSSEGC
jgi:hypothetical protein